MLMDDTYASKKARGTFTILTECFLNDQLMNSLWMAQDSIELMKVILPKKAFTTIERNISEGFIE